MCGFLLGVLEALFVRAFLVSDELQEVRDVIGAALVANALDPGMLDIVDVLRIVRRVVEQDLHAIGARFFQAASGPYVEQIGQAAGTGLVVSGLFIGEQQAGVLGAALRGGQSPLGIEQNRVACGVRTSVTSDLNSSIIASVISPPFSLASDFCSEPRWSMAAAAITPRLSFETFLSPASLPGVSFMRFLLERMRDECLELPIIVNHG